MKELNQVKDDIQRQAHAAWVAAGKKGTICMGTGSGKSRIAVIACENLLKENPAQVLLVSPTEKLRDGNWPGEFTKWGMSELYDGYVDSICFASLKNYHAGNYSLVILDEIHKITELSSAAFEQTGVDPLADFMMQIDGNTAVMGLTATPPDEKDEKYRLIKKIAPICFTYSLDQGVSDGIIADYQIRVIQMELDTVQKVYKSGTKQKTFYTTEASHYSYLEKMVTASQIEVNTLKKQKKDLEHAAAVNRAISASAGIVQAHAKVYAETEKKLKRAESLYQTRIFGRNRMLYSLPSRTELAKRCLKQMVGKRILVFCGSIEQCEELCAPYTFHSKTSDISFDSFNLKQSSILGVVDAANEGINFVDVEEALQTTVTNSERVGVQRLGRILRIRPGHKPVYYIICAINTVEERWLENSLGGFDPSKITYYSGKNVPV